MIFWVISIPDGFLLIILLLLLFFEKRTKQIINPYLLHFFAFLEVQRFLDGMIFCIKSLKWNIFALIIMQGKCL
jgi:hypothetical protein